MFLYLFSIALVVSCVICIKKRCYIAFFLPMMLFLPDYYGYEVSLALPLLTVKRMLFIVLYIYVFFVYRKNISLLLTKKNITPPVILISLSFFFRIASNLYYITTYGQATKTIFFIVFEHILLLVAIKISSLSKEQYMSIIKSVVWASTAMYIFGIAESFFGFTPFDSLYTVNRYILNEHSVRSGLYRATVTLGLPNYYGNFCVLTLPLIMFLYEKTKSRLYLVLSFLNVLACIHSGSRSSFLFIIATCVFATVIHLRDRKRLNRYLKNFALVAVSLVVLIIALSLSSSESRYYYTNTGKSLLNVVGFDFDLNEGAPENSGGFGSNSKGVLSRTDQFSGIIYVARINPVFGLGSGAEARGDMYYFWRSHWTSLKTFDVGYVEVFAEEGILGWISYLLLFVSFSVVLIPLIKSKWSDANPKYLFLGVISYLMCMLSSANMWSFLLFYAILIFNYSRNENA